MGIHNTFFNKKTTEFCVNGGLEIRHAIFNCIQDGDPAGVVRVFRDQLQPFRELLGDDTVYAKEAVLYVFAQLQLVAIYSGIPQIQCHAFQEAYYRAMDFAETVEDVIALFREHSTELARMVADLKREQRYSDLTKNCCNYIRSHLYEDLSVPSISQALRFSPSYLAHKFKEETGKTVQQYVRTERINEAKLLLRADYPTTEIAFELGFSSQSHFTDIFKRETGMTPTQYRKKV